MSATERRRVEAPRDPAPAREEAWAQFVELGRRRADGELEALFRSGAPAAGLDGPTSGILVSTSLGGAPDGIVRALTQRWMPWLGKRFHADRAAGDNVLARSARLPAKLLWPLYRTRSGDRGRIAFDFVTRVERGRLDPVDVLAIDYAPVRTNPRLIRRVRDELVAIAPGAYLGRILWGTDASGFTSIGWFALRQP